MKTMEQKRNIARIEVQRGFCSQCSNEIRKALQKIKAIGNVVCYPQSAMVIFSFSKANELSKALNVLTEMGYPEIGEDWPVLSNSSLIACDCHFKEYAA